MEYILCTWIFWYNFCLYLYFI